MMSVHVPPVEAPSDPQELAQAVGSVMYAGDAASQGLVLIDLAGVTIARAPYF